MPSETPFSAVESARLVLRLAPTGGLASLGADGAPFASLVTVATTQEGEPILLLSDIAVRTKNLKCDPRVSLLLVAPGGESGDPLAGARLSVSGTVSVDTDPNHRRRFLARHPEAAGYATFKDFNFYRITVIASHLVAGFGRIVDLSPADLLTDCSDCAALIAAEEGAVEHMNDDHAVARAHARKGGGVLAVLHDLNLAAAFADELAVLHQGTIVVRGPPPDVLTGRLLREIYGVSFRVTDDDGTLLITTDFRNGK